MNKIITISRQFGSGGREVGKRLADKLNYAYYDKELINAVAKESHLSEEYIEKYSEAALSRSFPLVFGNSFYSYSIQPSEQVQIAQSKVMLELAHKGDSIFVGRCADYVLSESNPFKIFIYASNMDFRIERCYRRVSEEKIKSEKEMKKKILKIDKQRAAYYEFYADKKWSAVGNYNLCIDTSKFGVKGTVDIIIAALNTCN